MAMSQYTGLFQRDVFRIMLTHLLPGGFALYPWFLKVESEREIFDTLYPDSVGGGSRVLLFVGGAIALGMVIENLGSLVENFYDWVLSKCNADVYKVWWQYLSLQSEPARIGDGYLASIVLRFKFELHASIAMCIAYYPLCDNVMTKLPAAVHWVYWCIFAFLAVQSFLSTRLMHKTRAALLEKSDK